MSTTAGHETIIGLLAGADLFKDLGGDDQAVCAAKMRELRFEKGQILFTQGNVGTRLYLMAKGQVRLAIASKSRRGLSFQIAVAGDLIGEIAVLDGGPRSATATALTPVTAYALERSVFQELWSARPGIANAIIAFLCWRLRKASDRLEATALYPMEVRVARFLLAALGDRQAPPRTAGASGAGIFAGRTRLAARSQPSEGQRGSRCAGECRCYPPHFGPHFL